MSTTAKAVKSKQNKSKGSGSARGSAASLRSAGNVSIIPAKPVAMQGFTAVKLVSGLDSVLSINARPAKIDSFAFKALKRLKQDFSADEKILLSKISNKGWTGYIKKVTDRLNGRHLGHAPSHVLAVTYAFTLNEILFPVVQGVSQRHKSQHSHSVPDEKVKDTVGLAQEIMFKQEEDAGPLKAFAGHLADIVLEENKINLSGPQKQSLVKQLRSQF